MEKSRSWPSAHDWKSCIPQKGIEGSNPSFSAKNDARMNRTFIRAFYTIATVAQSVEQLIRNQQVAGSSPASSSKGTDQKICPFFNANLQKRTYD